MVSTSLIVFFVSICLIAVFIAGMIDPVGMA